MKRYHTPHSLDLMSSRPTIVPLAAAAAAVTSAAAPLLSAAAVGAAAGAATALVKDDRSVSRLSLDRLAPIYSD